MQRHGAKATKKLGAGGGGGGGRSSFSRLFACICIYNVISVVHQKIGLLIKLFVVVVWKKMYRKIANERIGFSDKRSNRIKE